MATSTQAMKLKFGRKINLVKGQYVRLDAFPKRVTWMSWWDRLWLLKYCENKNFCYMFFVYVIWSFVFIIYFIFMLYVLSYIYYILICILYIFLFSIFILLDFKLLSSFVIMSLFSLHVQNWKYSYNKKYILIIRIFYVIWKFLLYDFHRPFSRQNLVVTSN